MSPGIYQTNFAGGSFPRVSGDEPFLLLRKQSSDLFSPREWG